MKISAAIREYLIEIEVRKYTQKTIRGYRNSLNLFIDGESRSNPETNRRVFITMPRIVRITNRKSERNKRP